MLLLKLFLVVERQSIEINYYIFY